jgi:hypothetical protein
MTTGYRFIDVCNLTGASPAQVRKWITRKWIPGAIPLGRYSYYPQATLDGVRRIQAIYADNCFGPSIKDRLHPPDDDEDGFTYDDDGALG